MSNTPKGRYQYPQSQTVIPPQQQNQLPAFNTQIPQQQATNPQRQQTRNNIRLVQNSGQPQQDLAMQQVPNQQKQLRNPQVQSTSVINQREDINKIRRQPRLIQNGLSSLQPNSPNHLGQPKTLKKHRSSQSMFVTPQSNSASQQQNIPLVNCHILGNSSEGPQITTLTPDSKRIDLTLNKKSGQVASAGIIIKTSPSTNQQNEYLPQQFYKYEQKIRQQMQTNTVKIKLVQASAFFQADTFECRTKSFKICSCCQEGIFENEDLCILRCNCKFHKGCLANFISDLVFKLRGSQLRCRCKKKIVLKDIKSIVLPNVIQQLLKNQLSTATTVLQLTKCFSLSGCPYLYKYIKGEKGKCQTCNKPIM